MKTKSHSQTSTSKKPEPAHISDAEFRRRLKNISEWRKKNFSEWRKKRLGKPHTKNTSGSLRTLRYEPIYRGCLSWIIEEFTQLRGGCTVHSNVGGYYLSRANKVVDDLVSVVYSDFPMDWDNKSHRAEVLGYCATLKDFLYENLSEEKILISAYPVSHFQE